MSADKLPDPRICARTGCGAPATHALKVNVPLEGLLLGQHVPISMMFGLRLCHACARKEKIETWMTDQFRTLVTMSAKMRKHKGKPIKPDFARAWISAVPLGSPEFQTFQQQSAKAKVEGARDGRKPTEIQ